MISCATPCAAQPDARSRFSGPATCAAGRRLAAAGRLGRGAQHAGDGGVRPGNPHARGKRDTGVGVGEGRLQPLLAQRIAAEGRPYLLSVAQFDRGSWKNCSGRRPDAAHRPAPRWVHGCSKGLVLRLFEASIMHPGGAGAAFCRLGGTVRHDGIHLVHGQGRVDLRHQPGDGRLCGCAGGAPP